MDFSPIVALLFIWLVISLPLSFLNKEAKKRQAARNADSAAAQKQKAKAPKQKQPAAPGPAGPDREDAAYRPAVMRPTITVTEHDDSVYQGSLNAETGEGYDPCHDEQLSSLTAAEAVSPAAETVQPGLQLGWSGSDVVRGFVMSEILKRKTR